MTYEEAINYIEAKTWSTTRLGLDRTRELLHRLGDPQLRLKFIHVAGSNGKGSTCAMIASILQKAGYKTGLYTSPHLMSFCERFQINGEWIGKRELARFTEQVREQAEAMEDHPSQFEISTAIAMLFFLSGNCDIVVLEVGMGGALDSTNAIPAPEVAVLCNIGLEHTEYLGDTVEKITETKAGIIKNGCDCVLYPNEPAVERIVTEICRERGVPLHKTDPDEVRQLGSDLQKQRFSRNGREYVLPLTGNYQMKNAMVALETVEVLRDRNWVISDEAIRLGLEQTSWPARMELLWEEPKFFLDGGHNPQCMEALAENIRELLPGQKVTFLLGILGDKDYRKMLLLIRDLAGEVVCVTPNSDRALPGEELMREVRAILGCPAVPAGSIGEGIFQALSTGEPVVAVGSLYMAGELRERFPAALKKYLRRKAIQGRNDLTEADRQERSRRIVERIVHSEEYIRAKTILSYRAVRAEVSLEELNRHAVREGKRVAYPLCIDSENMQARMPWDDMAYRSGAFGIKEPDPERSDEVSPGEIDLILCPCTAFDSSGGRIGMGAGYYDRYLKRCDHAVVWSVAFEAQKMTEVPMEDADVRMDAVVTEKDQYKGQD